MRNGDQHTGEQTLQHRSEQTHEQNVERASKHEHADESIASSHQAIASTSHAERLPQQEMAAPAPTIAPTDDQTAALGTSRGPDPRMSLLQTQCLKTSLAILSRPTRHARSLGFTSAVAGEGKSYLAALTATALADRTHRPVTLVDCNWDNPSLHARFDVAETPGLAEWLRQECDIAQVRHAVSPCLTVIPAGNALSDTVTLTDALRAAGPLHLLTQPDEALIVDMAPILTTPYGALLAQQLDAVLLVVRAGVTWDSYVREACHELSASPVEGVVLNATRSRIPRWLQRIL